MARRADSAEFKAMKKQVIKDFINAIESDGKLGGPKEIEMNLDIGDKTGSAWCARRRGAQSWSTPYLTHRITLAKIRGFLTESKAEELLLALSPDIGYTFDATTLFFFDVEKTVGQLASQILGLRKRICYGDKALDKAHYLTTSLKFLEPAGKLIAEFTQQLQAEERSLKAKFGTSNYKKIGPKKVSKNVSAWDVGYRPDWWTMAAPTKKETDALKIKIKEGMKHALAKGKKKTV